ncbi:85/88 kDa calcium-independent phospholipase A2 [Fasciola hepatica]|uniref:85/88 kDa calcium-independent phospholipase A2 n=1 Tax=Fasciola hepatica TaxID=6192 RepID=A0A4E0QZL3_FASHE|nr:85/88 kDa calcium-independent phospholipase A2 [Fasciola hepatica]
MSAVLIFVEYCSLYSYWECKASLRLTVTFGAKLMDVAYLSRRFSNFVKTALSSISPNKVVAYTQSQYETEYQGCAVLYEQDGLFYYYKVANHFEMVYVPKGKLTQNGEESPFAFSLFRFQGDEEAGMAAFVHYYEVLAPLHEAHVSLQLPCDRTAIEKMTTLCREQCGWSASHVAASLSWSDVFKCSALER